MLATVAPAAVKRDDFPSGSSVTSGTGSQPVYSPSSSSSGVIGSQSYSQPTSAGYSQSYSGSSVGSQYQGDHSASASSNNFQSQPSQQSGNLYYYYYPVQDKPKESVSYQASASNQYTSAVTPNFGQASSGSESSSSHIDNSGSSASAQSPSDLSYSAQDLSYSAQALNPGLSDYTGSAQASANYDQTLSSLASQLQQQYGYATSGNNAFGTQGNNAPSYASASTQQQVAYAPNYSYDPSHANTQVEQAGQYSASNQVPNYGVAGQQGATFIPAAQAAQLGGAIGGYNPAQAAQLYAQYPGAAGLHFGNFAAGSGPSSSFEPAASGYRRYGIGSFIMPMLALAGLSLLIPTVTSLTASGRKKRSVDSEQSAKDSAFGKYFERLERYYSIYKTAVEKEECMNRIICELGDAMADVRGKSALFS